jgi:DNA processing protein
MQRWEKRLDSDDYPECLRSSPRPPRVLYGCGSPELMRPGLAVVGARRATPYGLACAREFAGWAASQGVVIISGAAAGCDQAAHRAALEAGGSTVAVLGCGADVDYPPSAAKLLAQLREHHAVVAECPWGMRPNRYTFPNRNRIIAALASAVLVVEAALPSGTFSTADHALAAGRDVYVVPGSIYSRTQRGCNRLLRQGARPITEISDLADELRASGLYHELTPECVPGGWPVRDLDALARRAAAALIADPMRPDDAARALGVDVVTLGRALSLLESVGVVARFPDGRYGTAGRR